MMSLTKQSISLVLYWVQKFNQQSAHQSQNQCKKIPTITPISGYNMLLLLPVNGLTGPYAVGLNPLPAVELALFHARRTLDQEPQ